MLEASTEQYNAPRYRTRGALQGMVRLAVWLLFLAGPASAPAASESKSSDESLKVRQLTARYRSARATPQRRVVVIQDLVDAGPEGVAAAKDLIEKELKQIEGKLGAPPNTAALDAKIEKLRETLAKLRSDAELSKDQLQHTGLPTLDELARTYQQRAAQRTAYRNKHAKVFTQLDHCEELLRLLAARWKNNPPLPVDDFLKEAEGLSARATGSEDAGARRVAQANAKLAPKLDADVVAGMEAVNNLRQMCGLNPLVYDPKLCDAARGHSSDMKSKDFFSHESPVPGKKTPWDRATLAGTTASGENIYQGSNSPTDAIKGWFLSPGHHKNLLAEDNHRQGLGRTGTYWTQMFGQ